MDNAEEYLKRAEEADAMAAKATDPLVGAQLRSMAGHWRDLAAAETSAPLSGKRVSS